VACCQMRLTVPPRRARQNMPDSCRRDSLLLSLLLLLLLLLMTLECAHTESPALEQLPSLLLGSVVNDATPCIKPSTSGMGRAAHTCH